MTPSLRACCTRNSGATGSIELPVWGTISVNPDGSYSMTLNIQGIATPAPVRGVFFDQGKRLYELKRDGTAPPLLAAGTPCGGHSAARSLSGGTAG
jgi:hypothetical protein